MSVPKMYGVNLTDNDDDFDGNKDYCNTCGEECYEFEVHECSALVKKLRSELVCKQIDYDAHQNLLKALHTANERIVEFEDIKKGHLKVQKDLREQIERMKNPGNCSNLEIGSCASLVCPCDKWRLK